MPVNLKLLSVFVSVAEHGSFRKAAEELDRSQSAVSTQIRQLEEQLGVVLFHRTTRRVALTTEGQELLTHVRQAITELETGVAAMSSAAQLQRSRVIFALSPTIAAARLAQILTAFRAESPGVAVHVRELTAGEMLDSLSAQEVDFGIGPHVNRETDFHFHPVLQDPIWAAVPIDVKLSDEGGITLTELSRMPMLTIAKSAALRADVDRRLEEQRIEVFPQYEGMQVQTMLSLVEAGLGAAILPRIALPNVRGRYNVLPIRPRMTREICIITVAGKTLSPVAQRFVGLVEAALRAPAFPEPARKLR